MTRRHQAGMTLIEALVALTLLAILSTGLITSFRIAGRSYRQVSRLDAQSWDLLVAQRFLRSALESTYPRYVHSIGTRTAYGLQGTAEALDFFAPMPHSKGASAFYRYHLSLHNNSGIEDLTVVAFSDPSDNHSAEAAPAITERLLTGVSALEISYLPRVTQSPNPATWVPTWSTRSELPALIRVRVSFPSGDTRLWPELLITPLVTADVGCRFDPVARACRS